MKTRIKKFSEIRISDIDKVGGKNASLGEMYNQLTSKGVGIPNGFATTSYAFWEFLKDNKIEKPLKELLTKLDRKHFSNLETIGQQARVVTWISSFNSP
jgi:pyruvate,water dikinase